MYVILSLALCQPFVKSTSHLTKLRIKKNTFRQFVGLKSKINILKENDQFVQQNRLRERERERDLQSFRMLKK
ncbi:hypothetical protein QVD17_18735 [Tagetes erecta]|uniref:Uncharacterized protein n=1 Tax=Tagetes erecta TaxID=13708 RepID=A0AAD8KND6_TARER|nr:hypothetical protein QVD17_18735 [Tagetes erecta]